MMIDDIRSKERQRAAANEKTLGEWLKQPEYMRALIEILIEEHGLEAVLAAAGMEFAGCYDEPTKVTVSYEDEWRSDAAKPLYKRGGEGGP